MIKEPDIFILHWAPQILWPVLLPPPRASQRDGLFIPASSPLPYPRQIRSNKSPVIFSPSGASEGEECCGKGQGTIKSLYPRGRGRLTSCLFQPWQNKGQYKNDPPAHPPSPALPESSAPCGAPVRPAPDSRLPTLPEAAQCARGESGEVRVPHRLREAAKRGRAPGTVPFRPPGRPRRRPGCGKVWGRVTSGAALSPGG